MCAAQELSVPQHPSPQPNTQELQKGQLGERMDRRTDKASWVCASGPRSPPHMQMQPKVTSCSVAWASLLACACRS